MGKIHKIYHFLQNSDFFQIGQNGHCEKNPNFGENNKILVKFSRISIKIFLY